MADYKGWQTHPNGDIELNPMVGWGSATLPQNCYALRIEYISRPDQPMETPHSLQIAMTQPQLRELIEALGQLLSVPHIDPGDGATRQ
jgi:hypothetical protein